MDSSWESISTGVYCEGGIIRGWIHFDMRCWEPDQASVYQFVDDSWSQVGATLIGSSGGYGSGVGISDDGGIIAVGDWLDDEAGENAGRSLSINLWMESGVNLVIAFWGNMQGINLQGVH